MASALQRKRNISSIIDHDGAEGGVDNLSKRCTSSSLVTNALLTPPPQQKRNAPMMKMELVIRSSDMRLQA
jgi:hypothetical protein